MTHPHRAPELRPLSILRTMVGMARTQFVLHTKSSKKGQDQFRIHLWALHLNILGDEIL
jgi:hypothetical protein